MRVVKFCYSCPMWKVLYKYPYVYRRVKLSWHSCKHGCPWDDFRYYPYQPPEFPYQTLNKPREADLKVSGMKNRYEDITPCC